MRKMRVFAAAAAIAATTMVAAPLAAEAAPAAALPPDSVYFYYDVNRQGFCGSFPGSGNISPCINLAESMWNNHYPGSLGDVLVYYGSFDGTHYNGASRGVYQGAALNNLAGYKFDLGAGKAGYGQTLNRNIHSIQRTYLPHN